MRKNIFRIFLNLYIQGFCVQNKLNNSYGVDSIKVPCISVTWALSYSKVLSNIFVAFCKDGTLFDVLTWYSTYTHRRIGRHYKPCLLNTATQYIPMLLLHWLKLLAMQVLQTFHYLLFVHPENTHFEISVRFT